MASHYGMMAWAFKSITDLLSCHWVWLPVQIKPTKTKATVQLLKEWKQATNVFHTKQERLCICSCHRVVWSIFSTVVEACVWQAWWPPDKEILHIFSLINNQWNDSPCGMVQPKAKCLSPNWSQGFEFISLFLSLPLFHILISTLVLWVTRETHVCMPHAVTTFCSMDHLFEHVINLEHQMIAWVVMARTGAILPGIIGSTLVDHFGIGCVVELVPKTGK